MLPRPKAQLSYSHVQDLLLSQVIMVQKTLMQKKPRAVPSVYRRCCKGNRGTAHGLPEMLVGWTQGYRETTQGPWQVAPCRNRPPLRPTTIQVTRQ